MQAQILDQSLQVVFTFERTPEGVEQAQKFALLQGASGILAKTEEGTFKPVQEIGLDSEVYALIPQPTGG